jgi:hypothetical protein
MVRHASRVVATLVLTATAGCGGGGETGPEPVGSVSVTALPTSLTVPQGGTGTVTVTLTRDGGFADPVNVTVEGLPSGVSVSVSPTQLTGATTQAVVTVNVASTVAAGTYTATVRASADGVGAATTTYTLVVTAQSVAFTTSPASLSIQQGSSGTVLLNVARTNFAGNFTPTVSGNPSGMLVTFDPAPITGNSSQVTVNVGSGVPVNTYNVVIAASGVPGNPSVTLPVNVTAPAPTNVVWEFCNNEPLPLNFWRLNNGVWSEVSPTVVGSVTRYSFTTTGNNAGVAFTSLVPNARSSSTRDNRGEKVGTFDFGDYETTIIYRVSTELAGDVVVGLVSEAETCDSPGPPATLTSSFATSLPPSEIARLGFGGSQGTISTSTPSVDLPVSPGTYDLMAVIGPQPASPGFEQHYFDYLIRRGVTAPGPAATLNRTAATPLLSVPFTVTGSTAGSSFTFTQSFEGARGPIITFPTGSTVNQSGTGNLYMIAPTDRLTTDRYSLIVSNAELGTNVDNFRNVTMYFSAADPPPSTFRLPAAVPPFTVGEVAGAPVTTWSVTGQIPADYQTGNAIVQVLLEGAGGNTQYYMSASRAWLVANGFNTSYTLTGPVLPGFPTVAIPPAPFDRKTVRFYERPKPAGFVGPRWSSISVSR